jgi:hypothetical protein
MVIAGKGRAMTKSGINIISVLLATLLISTATWANGTVDVAVPARAGAVDGMTENSDAFIWRLFTEFTAPIAKRATFETWASDKDTFSLKPHWPKPGDPLDLHASVLEIVKMHAPDVAAISLMNLNGEAVDEPCKPPTGAAVGGFPTAGPGTPKPCIAEQVARNRPQFDYIVNNGLNTSAGRAAAYAKGMKVEMPLESVALKGDWIPLPVLVQWIPELKNISNVKKLYYTATVKSEEYALVALHVSSRQNPNWVWGTFEHFMNPGRCDYIGCWDSFGAQAAEVRPHRDAFNAQYGFCKKTAQLKALMAKSGASPIWENYCLKSTQVDFTAANGTPYVLGNSVVEGIVGNGTVAASSCITCHYYASFGSNGETTASAKAILPFNPTGKPISGVLRDAQQFAFMWGVVLPPQQ